MPFYLLLPSFQVIAAIGEQKASKALQEAATVIAESPSALQVGNGVNRRCGAVVGSELRANLWPQTHATCVANRRGGYGGAKRGRDMSNLPVFCSIRSQEEREEH